MKIKVGQAVKLFFGKSSLEMVYFEAVANALDAGATEIKIDIDIEAKDSPETLAISISDNGEGFTDKRYKKFEELLDTDDASHKGVGRLVYLCYFEKIIVNSFFDETNSRKFEFTESFVEEDGRQVTDTSHRPSGTVLEMSGYVPSRLRQYDFIQPSYLKNRLLEEFYSRFFQLKKDEIEFSITITSKIGDVESIEELTNADIPVFETVELESSINLIDKFYLHFSIEKIQLDKPSLIAAFSVDTRTVKVELIAPENIPIDYKMVFLLYSDWFIGKVDLSRQNLDISDADFKSIQTIFRNKVASIIEEKIPEIKESNKKKQDNLINHFPHLSGYFDTESVGYVSRTEVLQNAQDQFFKAQRELLDASSLTEDKYKKSIELSARALTEYILFRQITIEKLKKTSKRNSEAELHNLFAAQRIQFDKKNVADELYRNNAWLLDDKYMTYETVLSERELGDLIKFITDDENTLRDDDRPDIALVFSNNPIASTSFDIVIVEIKKRGISLEENMKTVIQLEKRARKLMKYYQNKIQRIWYYGIIEFNEEVELQLKGEYKELYSSGKMYYREAKVAIQTNPDIILPIGVFIWDIDAIANDADARNSAFLNLIKSKFIH